ncbi:MAG: Asp-tRNA(Asn)/Glu-tRNA(Gln) amidotransferase subunit GatC [Patescibacteria group bacterium]|nr:Asp-tRNA(Asn)/Glu-tRNA(Gln) amidotransferase subunit GatC [Patescibacteria group bacterium]MCL5095329.1 Asp-tRNA(Asn)/Glu-tRNA(Gln) amidotransferase subunit GatC [Patescibacteria group bacterium]
MNKQKITTAEIEHIAALAQLKLTRPEIEKFQKQLSQVLAYVSQLAKVKTQNVEPTSQVTGLENSFREDEIKDSLTQKEALSFAGEVKDNLFKVKAIF